MYSIDLHVLSFERQTGNHGIGRRRTVHQFVAIRIREDTCYGHSDRFANRNGLIFKRTGHDRSCIRRFDRCGLYDSNVKAIACHLVDVVVCKNRHRRGSYRIAIRTNGIGARTIDHISDRFVFIDNFIVKVALIGEHVCQRNVGMCTSFDLYIHDRVSYHRWIVSCTNIYGEGNLCILTDAIYRG